MNVETSINEIVRIPSPAPQPQALACDGAQLWIGSWATSRIYAIDARQGTVTEEAAAPGRPVGAVMTGDELRVICSEEGDSRFIRRYIPGHGFKQHEAVQCPDDTGSFLAFDGERLWLSQRYNKRIIELDAEYRPVRTLPIGEEIIGMAWVGERLYLSTWWGKERGGCHLMCLAPNAAETTLETVARLPFVGVALARDGDRLWTNDFKNAEIVAFSIPS